MYILTALIIAVSSYEIIQMLKRKEKKELIIFICFALFCYTVGALVTLFPNANSIAFYVLKLLDSNK